METCLTRDVSTCHAVFFHISGLLTIQ